MDWDLIICHDHEDKDSVALPLAANLRTLGFRVWIDEWELLMRDSISSRILCGLLQSNRVVVILSKNLLREKWPLQELWAALSFRGATSSRLLPVWHGVTADNLASEHAFLLDLMELETADGLPRLAIAIAKVLALEHRPVSVETNRPTILLPSCLNDCFEDIFIRLGYNVLREDAHRHFIEQAPGASIDVALEWQYGDDYCLILDLMRKLKQDCPVLVCRNWKSWTHEEALSMGFAGIVRLPGEIHEFVADIQGAIRIHWLRRLGLGV